MKHGLRFVRRKGGASAIHYALLVALIGLAALGAIAAMSGSMACSFETMRYRLTGGTAPLCAQPVAEEPGEPEEPIEEVDLANLSFPDVIGEPEQYSTSRQVRVTGINGTADVVIVEDEDGADWEAQVSVAGREWSDRETIRNGQSLRLRMRASASFGIARTASVTVQDKTVQWTVTTREVDDSPDQSFVFLPTPWLPTNDRGIVVEVVPYAEAAVNGPMTSQALFAPASAVPGNPFATRDAVLLSGFDPAVPLRLRVSGLPGADVLLQRNKGPWQRGTPAGDDADVREFTLAEGDAIGVQVEVPASAFGASLSVEAQLGSFSTTWPIQTRLADTTPDAMIFPPRTDLPLGDGTISVMSDAVAVTGIEWPAAFRLGAAPPPGAAMRACADASCDPAVAEGGGWSGWGDTASACGGCLLQLRALVPGGMDGEAIVDIVAGTEDAPFAASWTASTITDGPDALVVPPFIGANPGDWAVSAPVMPTGTVKPITVSVPSGSWIQAESASGTTVQLQPGESFTVAGTAGLGFAGEPGDIASIPLTVTGTDSTGAARTWSSGWSPAPSYDIHSRARDSRPDWMEFTTRERADPLVLETAGHTASGFDGTVAARISGCTDCALIVEDQRLLPGETGTVTVGDSVEVELMSAADYSTAVTAIVTLGSGADAVASAFTVITREVDLSPALHLRDKEDVLPGSLQLSDIVRPDNFDVPVALSTAGPASAEFRIGSAAGWSDPAAGWQTAPATLRPGDALQLRMTAPAGYGWADTIAVSAGKTETPWSVVAISNGFAFGTTLADPGEQVASRSIAITGLSAPTLLSLTGEASAVLSVGGTAAGRSATVDNGDIVRLDLTAPTGFGASTVATATLGARQAGWTVTVRDAVDRPTENAFPNLVYTDPGAGRMLGVPMALTGFDNPLPFSVTGPLNPRISVNGGAFTASGTVPPGATVQMEVDRLPDYSNYARPAMTVGSGVVTQTTSSRERRSCPAVTFTAATDIPPASYGYSEEVTVTDIDGPIDVSLVASSQAQLRVNGGAWVSAGQISAGDKLKLRLKAPATSNANAEVLAVFSPGPTCEVAWAVNPLQPLIAFDDAKDLAANEVFARAGTPGPVTGLTQPIVLSVQASRPFGFLVNDATQPQNPVTVENGDSVTLVGTAPASFNTVSTATVTVDGVDTLLAVTTRTEKTAPDGFNFIADLALPLAETVCHPWVEPYNYDRPKTLTVSGDPTAELRVEGGATGRTVTISPGQRFRPCFTTADAYEEQVSLHIAIAGTSQSDNWLTRTRPMRTMPDSFGFAPPTYNAPRNAPVSYTVVLSGFDEELPASIAAAGSEGYDAQPTFTVNGGAATTGPVNVREGDTLVVTLTTRNLPDYWSNASLTVGPRTELWETYTGPDNIPDPFDFTGPNRVIEPNELVDSNPVTVQGFVGQLRLTLSGNGTASIVLNGSDTQSTDVLVTAGDTVTLRTRAASSYSTKLVTTATLGPYASDVWEVRTRILDNQPDPFPIAALRGAEPGQYALSQSVTVTGYDAAQYLSLATEPAGQTAAFSTDDGRSWHTAGQVAPGSIVLFRVMTPAAQGAKVELSIQLGTTAELWSVTNRTGPAPLVLQSLDWQPLGVQVCAPFATVQGLSGSAVLAATQRSPGLAQVRLRGGPLLNAVSVSTGSEVQACMTSATTELTAYTAAFTLGNTAALSWTVTTQRLIVITPSARTASARGEAASGQYSATGGIGALSFSIASGSLPAGLTLGTDGAIGGATATSVAEGSYPFVLRVTDSEGHTQDLSATWTIAPPRAALFSVGGYFPNPGNPATTLTDGARTINITAGGNGSAWQGRQLDRVLASGRGYFEVTFQNVCRNCIIDISASNGTDRFGAHLRTSGTSQYFNSRKGAVNTTGIGRITPDAPLTVGFAVDLSNGRIWYARNGAWNGNIAPGTAPTNSSFTFDSRGALAFTVMAIVDNSDGSPAVSATLATEANQFRYTPPAGFGLINAIP